MLHIELYELYDLAEHYKNFSCKTYSKKYKVGEVLDEEMSVRWNREEVERLNKVYEAEVKRLQTEKNQLYTELADKIKMYIIQETGVSEKKAEQIYNYAYNMWHSYGFKECLANLEDLLVLFT